MSQSDRISKLFTPVQDIEDFAESSFLTMDEHFQFLKTKVARLGFQVAPEFVMDLPAAVREELFQTALDACLAQVRKDLGVSEDFPLLWSLHCADLGMIRNFGVTLDNFAQFVKVYGFQASAQWWVDFLESFASQGLGVHFLDFKKALGLSQDIFKEKKSPFKFLKWVELYQKMVVHETAETYPNTVQEQLWIASKAFFKKRHRSKVFLKAQLIPSPLFQEIRGRVQSRDPFSGNQKKLSGFFEKVNFKTLYPLDLIHPTVKKPLEGKGSFEKTHARDYQTIKSQMPGLEKHFKQVVEADFCTFKGKCYFIDFFPAEISSQTLLCSLMDLYEQNLIDSKELCKKLQPRDLKALVYPTLTEHSKKSLKLLASDGLVASPGLAVGRIFNHLNQALKFPKPILLLSKFGADEWNHFRELGGIILQSGKLGVGISSHIAMMARSLCIPCVSFESIPKSLQDAILKGHKVSLEAHEMGKVYLGKGQFTHERLRSSSETLSKFVKLLQEVLESQSIRLKVKVNIRDAQEARLGKILGASGVGLYRSEYLFLEDEKNFRLLKKLLQLQLKKAPEKKLYSILKSLEKAQSQELLQIFKENHGMPVTIRLADIPLSELFKKESSWSGMRASRFAMLHPELYQFQIRAVFQAVCLAKKEGIQVIPSVIAPLVSTPQEFEQLKQWILQEQAHWSHELQDLKIAWGCMIELPAAAIRAGELAQMGGDQFLFGTNDLTQSTLGIPRQENAHFLVSYVEKGIFKDHPFQALDRSVEKIIDLAIAEIRKTNSSATLGMCGEQVCSTKTLKFCMTRGFQYVSCSPVDLPWVLLSLFHLIDVLPIELKEAS